MELHNYTTKNGKITISWTNDATQTGHLRCLCSEEGAVGHREEQRRFQKRVVTDVSVLRKLSRHVKVYQKSYCKVFHVSQLQIHIVNKPNHKVRKRYDRRYTAHSAAERECTEDNFKEIQETVENGHSIEASLVALVNLYRPASQLSCLRLLLVTKLSSQTRSKILNNKQIWL